MNTIESLESRRMLSAGDLDPTFGKAGVVTASFGGDVNREYLAVQRDGRIVVAMAVTPKGSKSHEVVVARFKTDGKLDGSFGKSGKTVTPASGEVYNLTTSPRIDTQNRIVVRAGNSLMRFTSSGTLDLSFG